MTRSDDHESLVLELRAVVSTGALSAGLLSRLEKLPILLSLATGGKGADDVRPADASTIASLLLNAVDRCDPRLRPGLIELYQLDEKLRGIGQKERRHRGYKVILESGAAIFPEAVEFDTIRDRHENRVHSLVAEALLSRRRRPLHNNLFMVEPTVESSYVRQSIDWAALFCHYEVLRQLSRCLYSASAFLAEQARGSGSFSASESLLKETYSSQFQFWLRLVLAVFTRLADGWYPFVPSGDTAEEACLMEALTSISGGTLLDYDDLSRASSRLPSHIVWDGEEGQGQLSLERLLADSGLVRLFEDWTTTYSLDSPDKEQLVQALDELALHAGHLVAHIDGMFRPSSPFLETNEWPCVIYGYLRSRLTEEYGP